MLKREMNHERTPVAIQRCPWARWTRRASALVLTLLVSCGMSRFARAEENAGLTARDPVTTSVVWVGRVIVEQEIIVAPEATLTISPGAEVLFRDGAGLLVHGALIAEGTAEKPIRFGAAAPDAAPGAWAGITLTGDDDRSRISHCILTHANGIAMGAGRHRVEHCEIREGIKGIVLHGRGTEPVLRNNYLADLSGGGIECLNSSAPLVEDTMIVRCGPFGISATLNAVPAVLRNTITGCEDGIVLSNTIPLLRDNILKKNRRGIVLTQVNGGHPIQGNQILEGELGILCQQFSSPVITGNTISGNKDGIVCFQGGRAAIEGNTIENNGTGVSCVQLADAQVRGNVISGNKRGIYLQTSSYAEIHGNNIFGNEVQLELGDMMSADWEKRTVSKPQRGLQQQRQARSQRTGSPPPQTDLRQDGADIRGFIDATENWWGESATREMEQKGPDANITGLLDSFDAPTRTYEGFVGEFALDRIRYAPWAKDRIAAAGAPAPVAPPAEGARE